MKVTFVEDSVFIIVLELVKGELRVLNTHFLHVNEFWY